MHDRLIHFRNRLDKLMGRVAIRIGVVQVVVAGVMLTQPTAGGFTTNSSQSRDIV
jgi:hypothetical protein